MAFFCAEWLSSALNGFLLRESPLNAEGVR
jgi:hypothetical protein